MNSIKILMALMAMCVLAMPAFSMPDRGTGQEICKCKQICDCAKPMMGDKCQEDNQNPCDSTEPMMGPEAGPIKVKVVRSMMGDRCQDDMPMMGDRCQDDRQNPCDFSNPMGQDDKLKVKVVRSMMEDRCQDDDRNPCDCPRPMMEDRC